MWHFQRIICIWICCVSCMFGTTQLSSSLVRAVPYEYFDEHEQSFYDLDSEQIQAKYDTRLLSQQMLQTQQQQQLQQQLQQQQQHLENLKGFHTTESDRRSSNSKQNDDDAVSFISPATAKLKNNDGHMLGVGTDLDDDATNNERNDGLEERATKPAALTTTITETLDELHLPRAASCFTNGQKFTHGQKVPRLDNCEVCLCMDGEIFCWWEKCDKKPTKATIAYDDYSTPFDELSTTRMHLNPKTTYKTTLKPMKKPKINEDYKYDDDDSAEIREMQQEYEGLREQLMQNEHDEPEQHRTHHNKKMAKKKIYQQQEGDKHDKKIEEENKMKNKKMEEKQLQNHKQHKTNEQHHHTHNHNNNRNNNHDYGLTGSSSKILNFPENLPSVLYYDYKTEEHHQHQHQHREQHLKHQKQKQQQRLLSQQHEKELKHQQQQQIQKNHVNRQHEYGQDFNTHAISTLSAVVSGIGGEGQAQDKSTRGSKTGDEEQLYSRIGESSSTTFKYFSNGNENIYNDDMQTDSDILPEPPTNKPKYLTSITDTTTSAKTTGIPLLQFYRFSTSMMATTAGTTTKSTKSANTTGASTNSPPTASVLLKKNIVSPWDYNQTNRDKISNNNNNHDNNGNGNTNSNDNKSKSSEDTIEADDQDDAFHRWLTSTEKSNKNNFTLNDAIIGRDDGASGLDGSNNDYNLDERNYENINWETDTGLVNTLNAKAKPDMRPLTIKVAATTTAINAFNMAEAAAGESESTLHYENFQNPKYEQNFSENTSHNNKSNNLANSNEIINSNSNNNNNSPFSSSAYGNNNGNNNEMVKPTSDSRGAPSSTTSNEENGVASVVNIDIMLTASSADSKKQLQPQQTTMEETNNQHRQLQLQEFENRKQIANTQLKFIQPQVLTSKTNDVVNNNPLYSIINDNTRNVNASSNNNNNITNTVVGDGIYTSKSEQTQQLQNVGVNLSSSSSSKTNNFNTNSASSQSLSSSSDSFKFNHLVAMVPQSNSTSAAATPPSPSTTLSPERQCNVMGTLYKIGDILPQDTGNCLQCICIDGSTSDDTPRVTCSPHNCPPLVLPDLFDATGY